MTWVFGIIAVTLGIFFLWGLVSPRSQWRVLTAWSVSDPHSHEPGGAAYGWRRLLSAVGVLGLGAVGIVSVTPDLLSALPQEGPLVTPVEEMWGSPTPQLVDRSVRGSTTPPATFIEVPVLGYQDLDELDEVPLYLIDMKHFSLLGDGSPAGYIGSYPGDGYSGVGPADLVVNVRGPVLCIPREAVVLETDTSVQIAVYYGLPEGEPAEDGTPAPAPDHAAGCPADAAVTGSVLIPITLNAELGDRTVETTGGEPIRKVELPD